MPDITNARQFGALVWAERRKRGLTQAVLAERSGVSRAWLARFEAGHPAASVEPIFRVLRTLGLALTLVEPRISDEERAVLDALKAQEVGK